MFLAWNLSSPEHAWSQNSSRTFCDVSLADGKHLVMNVVWRHEGRERVKAKQKDCYPTTCLRRLSFGLSTASCIIPCDNTATDWQPDSPCAISVPLGLPHLLKFILVHHAHSLYMYAPGLSPLWNSVLVHRAHSLYMLMDCRPCGILSWFTMLTHCACSWIVALVEVNPGSPCTLTVHAPGLPPLWNSVLVHHAHSLCMLLDCRPCWSLSWLTMHTHCTCSWIVSLVEVY